MGKLGTTTINGDLIVSGDIICKTNDIYSNVDGNESKVLVIPINGYIMPMVIWHGEITISSSSSLSVGTYHSSACDISVSYISTGVISITMSGDNIPYNYNDYQLLISSRGGGTNNNDPIYITVPESYKTANSFRLIMTSGTSSRNGQVELSIVKMVRIKQ